MTVSEYTIEIEPYGKTCDFDIIEENIDKKLFQQQIKKIADRELENLVGIDNFETISNFYALEDNKNQIIILILKHFASKIFMMKRMGYSIEKIIEQWRSTDFIYPIDGRKGIKLVDCDEIDVNIDNMICVKVDMEY